MIGWAIVAGGLGAIIAFGLSATPKWELDDWPPSWRADAAGLPRPMHAHRALHHGVWEAVHDESAGWPACGDAERGASTVRGAAGACERDGCRFFWIVALRHGERIEVTSDDLPDGSRVRFYRHGAGGTLDPDEFDEQGKQPLAAGQRASFTAGLSAWYGVGLTVPDMQPSDVRSMCASIARP
jgi:hypothetical protein